ncbi:MAG TPA: cysteine desulfurase family protein [Thermoanaerobaculia bacterium]
MARGLPIYLDYAATTPLDPRVLEAMLPSLTGDFGNAASRSHAYGWRAEALVKGARETLARALGGEAKEIVFTSGATESDNLALIGAVRAARAAGTAGTVGEGRNHVVTSQLEHSAVLDAARQLEREGFRVTYLPPDRDGVMGADAVAEAIGPETVLVSIMTANNETGTLNPVADIGRVCRERSVLFHTDAVQAFGKVSFDVSAFPVDMVSISAHKICGPKGIGALWVRAGAPRVRLSPLTYGGGHERGLRSGTLNVPAIVGFAAAARLALESREEESLRVGALRDRLHASILEAVPDALLNGHPARRLPGTLNLAFAGVDGDALFLELSGLAVSPGAACSSASLEPSHVLLALGRPPALARASIRFSLGRFTTAAEVEAAATLVAAAVRKLRAAR